MKWKLLIDENLPAGLADALGVPCLHASVLENQPSDEAIWQLALQKEYVILTKDADFFDQLTIHGSPPKVVWIRTGNMRRRDLEALVVQLWPRISSMLDQADLVEVHRDRLEAIKF